MSTAIFCKWRAKFGGMDASMMKRLKELEDENKRLKKMYAEERLKAEIRQEALEGRLLSPSQRREMAIEARERYGVSVRFVCHCLDISVATYYYQPKLSVENQPIAD